MYFGIYVDPIKKKSLKLLLAMPKLKIAEVEVAIILPIAVVNIY
jgi:hypothetical protein